MSAIGHRGQKVVAHLRMPICWEQVRDASASPHLLHMTFGSNSAGPAPLTDVVRSWAAWLQQSDKINPPARPHPHHGFHHADVRQQAPAQAVGHASIYNLFLRMLHLLGC